MVGNITLRTSAGLSSPWSGPGVHYCPSQDIPAAYIPLAVNSVRGNEKLVAILNSLGHTVSYSQLQLTDRAICLQKLAVLEGELLHIFCNCLKFGPGTLCKSYRNHLEASPKFKRTGMIRMGVFQLSFWPSSVRFHVAGLQNLCTEPDTFIEDGVLDGQKS